jgi:hypothetical protein
MKLRTVVLARALALLWAGFWAIFFVAEALAWKTPARLTASWAGIGLLFLMLALVPWGWEGVGGVLLAVSGLFIGVAYAIWAPPRLPFTSRVITTLVLGGPPLAAGIVFFMHHRAVASRTL